MLNLLSCLVLTHLDEIHIPKEEPKYIPNKSELNNLVKKLIKKELQKLSNVSKEKKTPEKDQGININVAPSKKPVHKRAKSDVGGLKIVEQIKAESKEVPEISSSHKICSRLTSRRCSNAVKPAAIAEVMEIIQAEEEKKLIELSTKETFPGSGIDKELTSNSMIKLNDIITQDREKLIKYNELYIAKHKAIPATTLDNYKFVKLIGKGAFGKVTLGIHKLTGKYVAIKTIEKSYMKDEFSRKKVFREVYIMKKIRHANVIRLLEVFESTNHLLIVMEYAGDGDLLQYVKKHKKLKEEEAKVLFRQIVYGLGHIHSRSVLHRDIKLDNILLDSDHSVKICDFGVSKIIEKR